jgi:AcrR family transcriptional regulator
MARPRNADAELTKQRILDAAIERFGRQGLKETSLRAIAADVGVTFATVHHYFGSKSTLYTRCLEAAYDDLAELRPALLETLMATGGGVEDKVSAVAKRAFHYARQHTATSRFLLRATLYEDAAGERMERSQRQYLDGTSELLAPLLGRDARALRVPLQGLMFLLTRMAVTSERELANIAGGSGTDVTEALADYVARVAVSTLLETPT